MVRVIWRTIRDWLEATVALIEVGGATLDEALFPSALGEGRRETAYQA